MKKAFFLLVLLAVSFAANWQYSAGGSISTKPVAASNRVFFGSEDGKLYSLDVNTGTKKWDYNAGETPIDLIEFSGDLVFSTEDGKVYRINKNGGQVWTADLGKEEFNATTTYGIDNSPNGIFVTADNGLYKISSTGETEKLIEYSKTATPPYAEGDYVLFGAGENLYKVKENGEIEWKNELEHGVFWNSRPAVQGNNVYVGALDNRLHAFFLLGGMERWTFNAKNWVISSPLVKDDSVYFGSNNGKIYSVSATSGQEIWSAQADLAIQGKPESGYMAGKEVIFFGGTDNNIYAVSEENGDIIWKFAAMDWVIDPVFHQNSIIFGSLDGNIYSKTTERACSILYPKNGMVTGHKELVVTGMASSQNSGATVSLVINDGPGEEANLTGEEWVYILDPNQLTEGTNTLSCIVSDSAGTQGQGTSEITVVKDITLPMGTLVVTVSQNVIEGTPFTIYINDAEDGSTVDRFTLSINGDTYTGNGNITATIENSGKYDLVVEKTGFNDANLSLEVHAAGLNPIYIVGALAIIAVIVWQVWERFLKQRFTKKEES